MAYVYEHIRLDKNETFYIGIGSDTIYKRANEKSRRNNIWKKIVNKSNYKVRLVFTNITWEQACILEQELIKSHGRLNIGTGSLANLTDGGEGTLGIIKTYSIETRQRLSDSSKGNKNMLGRKFTEEHKNKLSKSHKGYKVKEETKQKISASTKGMTNRLGTKLSKEHADKLKLSRLGKGHSTEAKQKIAEKNGKPIINTLTNEIYLSVSQLSSILGISTFKITKYIRTEKFGLNIYKFKN